VERSPLHDLFQRSSPTDPWSKKGNIPLYVEIWYNLTR
jgi:hypothetical protein